MQKDESLSTKFTTIFCTDFFAFWKNDCSVFEFFNTEWSVVEGRVFRNFGASTVLLKGGILVAFRKPLIVNGL